MAPVQNTFCIVPNAPSAINGGNADTPDSRPSRPPMTTKQAKKAYQKATKGPKLSKAERRRQDLFEQDRIRREFEKEKNQARAKAARDKKKEKEDKDRAERKKKGLPLIDVRPSQDTLARFMFPNAKKTKQPGDPGQTVDEVLKNEDCDQEEPSNTSDTVSTERSDTQPPSKRQKTECQPQNAPKRDFRTQSPSQSANVTTAENECPRPVTPLKPERKSSQFNTVTPPVKESVGSHSLNESFDSVASLMDGLNTPEKPKPQNTPPAPPVGMLQDARISLPPGNFVKPCNQFGNESINPCPRVVRQDDQGNNSNDPPGGPTPMKTTLPAARETTASPSTAVSETVERKPLRPQNDSITNIGTPGPLRKNTSTFTKPSTMSLPSSKPNEPPKPSPAAPSSSVFRRPQAKVMGPPSLPPKFKTPNSRTTSQAPNASRFAPKKPPPALNPSTPKSQARPSGETQGYMEAIPPSSTQLFMLDYADDLFPSPSQEVKELFNDLKSSPARSRAKPEIPPPVMAPPKTHMVTKNSHSSFGSKSTPTHKPNPARQFPQSVNSARPSNKRKAPSSDTGHLHPARSLNSTEVYDMPFFCTQDLLMSSQDIDELSGKPPDASPQKPPITGTNRGLGSGTGHAGDQTNSKHVANVDYTPSPAHQPAIVDSQALDTVAEFDFDDELVAETWEQLEAESIASKSVHGTPKSQVQEWSQPSIPDSSSGRPGKATKSIDIPVIPDHCKQPQEHPMATHSHHLSNNAPLNSPSPADVDQATSHSSPRPFFTNSCKEVMFKFALERSKTSAWEAPTIRQENDERFSSIRRQEEERLNELLMEAMDDDDDMSNDEAEEIKSSTSAERARDVQSASARSPRQSNVEARLSASRPEQDRGHGQRSQGTGTGTGKARPLHNRPRSSYEKMLLVAGLGAESTPKNEAKEVNGIGGVHGARETTVMVQQSPMMASQETDYGDAELDNELRDMI